MSLRKLNSVYVEYLYPDNKNSRRRLAREHGASRTSLQDRINVGNTKAAETQNRQRLTHLKEKALKD
jgi:hypothetical protein